jgi:hypothetical protein
MMQQQLRSFDTVSGNESDASATPKPEYELPRIRMINEEEVLSAFQVVLSAGSAGWWIQ